MIEYKENLEIVYRTYERFIAKDKGNEYALIRIWEEYYNDTMDIEDEIINIAVAELTLKQDIISEARLCRITKIINNYKLLYKQIENQIQKEDNQDLIARVKEIEEKIRVTK